MKRMKKLGNILALLHAAIIILGCLIHGCDGFYFLLLLSMAIIWPVPVNQVLLMLCSSRRSVNVLFYNGVFYIAYSLAAYIYILAKASDPLYCTWLLFVSLWVAPIYITSWITAVLLERKQQQAKAASKQ